MQPLPHRHGLFIATPTAIHLRSRISEKVLFECETPGGIACARPSKDNSSLIAVADSHVVVLYDGLRGRKKRYRLSRADVSVAWRLTDLQVDNNLGRAASSSLLARFTYTLLHNNTEYVRSGVFYLDCRTPAIAVAAPFPTNHTVHLKQRRHTVVSLANTTNNIPPG